MLPVERGCRGWEGGKRKDLVLLECKRPASSRVTNCIWVFVPCPGNMFNKSKTGAGCWQESFVGARAFALIAVGRSCFLPWNHIHQKQTTGLTRTSHLRKPRPSACRELGEAGVSPAGQVTLRTGVGTTAGALRGCQP